MHVHSRHAKRQAPSLGGTSFIATTTAPLSELILATDSAEVPITSAPPIGTVTSIIVTPSSSTVDSSPASSAGSAAVKNSSIGMSTVVGACVGAFAGLALVVCIFIWWSRHPATKTRGSPRSPISDHRNVRGEEDQERTRSGMWKKLDEDEWEGMPQPPPPTRQMSQQEVDEKNFSMFKKRSPSTRTTRTTKALEEHGFEMPPVEFSKYHPHLAEELSLQQPERHFGQRQDSGISWDGETVGDNSFLSLRSVRIESGAMSPTMAMAKMTPPPMSHLHRWESAEVITLEDPIDTPEAEYSNPFADVDVERRKSGSNPFFNAGDSHRPSRGRSRSNSHSASRNPSRTRAGTSRSHAISQSSQVDPFADIHMTAVTESEFSSHSHNDSIASGDSGNAFASEHAMKSLIAALDLTQDEVEERLRVVSMRPSTTSQYSSTLYGASSVKYDEEDDIATMKNFPIPPTSASYHP
ncbi:hypothetical protein PHLCEN_2v7176 [Hermanssonia centrifuga]|uniref:Uncharacterized protein n=1 Tax=Hermanssonia centrifuga TaxID=98765 RepID=A0A2R6NX40_9APHY|nr:hypothetical protein PHLCEN_2v7176 [Hermanssonia centrifuga]